MAASTQQLTLGSNPTMTTMDHKVMTIPPSLTRSGPQQVIALVMSPVY